MQGLGGTAEVRSEDGEKRAAAQAVYCSRTPLGLCSLDPWSVVYDGVGVRTSDSIASKEAVTSTTEEHYCTDPAAFPLGKLFKPGEGAVGAC
jgi:hypothetical protein